MAEGAEVKEKPKKNMLIGVVVDMERFPTIRSSVVTLTIKTNVKTVLSVTIKHVDTMGNQ